MIGQTVSHYRILEKIGQGGMGEIYLAEDTKLKRQVALKFLPRQMTVDPEAKERFEREAQAAAALNHPNIITIHEIGEHDGQVFIAMEFVEGKTLKELISGDPSPITHHPLPITQVIDITTQIASGLAAAHEKGIVHRDIKPQNILVDKNNRVKILDFGLAKLKGVSSLTKESSTLGTVHYMSPEQAMGKEVDQRSDIWSLGVVIYETLTGQAPFKGTYDQAVIYSILNEEPEPLAGLRPEVPAELKAIVGKCLEKEIDVRYQHADDLFADLKRAKRDTKPITPPEKLAMAKAPRKKSRPFMAVAALSLMIAALAIAAYFLFKPEAKLREMIRPEGRHSLAVVYFENNSGDKSLDKWRSQLAELLITDLSQSRYIDVVSGDQIFGILKKLNLLDAQKYSTEDLRQVADMGGSDYLLHGSYITAGKNLLLNVALKEAKSGKILSAQRLEIRGEEEIFGKVDEITRKIKLDCDFTPQQLSNDPDTELAAITTRSPQAYEYFNQGETQKRLGNQRQCIELMEKAVAIDPDFAMAWRTMATAYSNMSYFAEERKYLKKAMDLGGRVSERERLLIAGQYYKLSEKSYPQAIASYEKVLGLYPEDSIATLHLGNLYRTLEQWDKAELLYRKNLLKPDQDRSHYSAMNIAEMYEKMGEYQKALQVQADQQARFTPHPYLYWGMADANMRLGRYDAAMDDIDKGIAISKEVSFQKGLIFFCRGDLAQAEALFRKELELSEVSYHALGLIDLSNLAYAQGRYDEARSHCQKLLSLCAKSNQSEWERMTMEGLAYMDGQEGNWAEAQKKLDRILADAKEQDDWKWLRTIFYDKGIAYARAGMFPKAQDMDVQLQAYIDRGLNKKLRRMHDHLQGMIALQKGDAPAAIQLINQAIALLPGGANETYRDTLGDACLKAGRLQEAQQAYEAVTLSPIGRMNPDYGRCLLMLGKTYEKLGEIEKAIQNYRQFGELWQGCDASYRPMVAEAEQAIKRLRGDKRL